MPGSRSTRLRQGYLAEERDVAVRVRVAGEVATLTVKAGRGVSRVEVEHEIPLDEAEALWIYTEGRRIDKVRTRVPLETGLVAEVDRYEGDLAGLCTIEVEFPTEQAARAFVPPVWFGREVTGADEWTNAALARHGRPR